MSPLPSDPCLCVQSDQDVDCPVHGDVSAKPKRINFRLLRRKAIAFAAATLDSADFDEVWGELQLEDAHGDAAHKAQRAAVKAIRSLLK